MTRSTSIQYRYPIYWTSRQQETIRFQSITPADRKHLVAGLDMMSEKSKYQRFFSTVKQLTDKELDYFTQVDQYNHVAWGALANVEGKETGIGVGRFVRIKDQPRTAEYALTVVDNYQNSGVGTFLFAILYNIAADLDIHYLVGIGLPAHPYAADKLKALGAEIQFRDGLFESRVPVYTDFSKLATPYGQQFQKVLQSARAKIKGD